MYVFSLFFVIITTKVSEGLFQLDSPYEDVQGVCLAIASAGALFAVFRDQLCKFAELG